MKMLHVCLIAPVTDGLAYQDNLLPKYHVQMGWDTTIVTSRWIWDSNGKMKIDDRDKYVNEDGVKVIRLPMNGKENFYNHFKRFYGFLQVLNSETPDIIFIHGCQFLDIDQVVKYLKKHHDVKVFVDNHADFSNSARGWVSKNILHKIIWRHCAHKIEPYTTKFYGVLPARVDFLKNIYKLPAEKCELLVMGADDELVEKAKTSGARKRIRDQYKIADTDFLIMTGGKIDQWKTQTLLLMQAVHNIKNESVKLIVFGSVTQELMEQVKSLADGTKVQYIGWIQSKDSYDYFEAADLVVFPGRHSVMWEQVVGQGKPMLVKDWVGTHHVDIGGNVKFLTKDSVEEIQGEIEHLLANPDEYQKMTNVAEKEGMKVFSYKEIARRAIEV